MDKARQFHRAKATRYRALADDNEQIADILEELRKINARVPRAPSLANLNRAAISRAVH